MKAMDSKDYLDRRELLGRIGDGLFLIALSTLLGTRPLEAAHRFPPKAKRVLQIFCPGGVSQVDTFDYKPELKRRSGEPLPGAENLVTFQGKNGNLMQSPWGFTRRGESGKWVSDMLPRLGELVDDVAFIHSMTSKTNIHGQACIMMNTGFVTEGFPSAGAWVSYGLGSENDNLPTFVAIPDVRGLPTAGPANWSSGFLPAEHQAMALNATEPIRNVHRPPGISESSDLATRELTATLNRWHAQRYPGNPILAARQSVYELAARMQLSATH